MTAPGSDNMNIVNIQSMLAVCTPRIILSRNLPLRIILIFICMRKINTGDPETVVGKVGNPVFLHPTKHMKNAYEVRWKTLSRIVGKLKNGKLLTVKSRYEIFPNCSLRINDAKENDSGIYRMELFDKDGKNSAAQTIKLSVQDDVSMPVVHTSCTLDGRVKLSCSVQQWEQVTVYWAKHSVSSNYTLHNAVAQHRTLYLRRKRSGYLVCVASNGVSQKSSLPVSKACRAHISSLTALGLFLALSTLAIAIGMQMKKPINVPRKDTENCYAVMRKKSVPPPNHDISSSDAESFYVVMHKKTDTPHNHDVSDYVICNPAPPRIDVDVTEHTGELENVYI